MRRLNDPYPLPVSWEAADASLADDWDVLVTLAMSGAGWPIPDSRAEWASKPEDLTGGGNQLVGLLNRIPTRRLVVLGEAGSGKTMLMVRLVLDLLADRVKGGPVPVIIPLASWNPAGQDLHEWLADRLPIDYPLLVSASVRTGLIGRLLSARLIVPILDGLDEMSEQARILAIAAISGSLRPGEPVIVTCRSEGYQNSVQHSAGTSTAIRAAAVIRLCPLQPDQVANYLIKDVGGARASARWAPVLAMLGTPTPTGQALTTPLMVSLARVMYNPRTGESAEDLASPAELCSFPDKTAVEAHLLDGLIPASYRPRLSDHWDARRAKRWLEFLASHLEYQAKSPDFAWWQLAPTVQWSSFLPVAGLAMGLSTGLGAGLALWLVGGPVPWLLAGLLGLVAGSSL